MNEIIHQILSMPPPFNMVTVIVVVVMGVGLITSVAREIRKYASHRESMEVIRELADRGMSADQIERLLKAGPDPDYCNRELDRV